MKEAHQEIFEAERAENLGRRPPRLPRRVPGLSGPAYYEQGLVTRVGKLELRAPRP